MVKKTAKSTSLTLDDYGFTDDFDFPEMDFEVKPPKNNREAILKVGRSAADEIVSQLRSPSFFRGLVKKALPRGYGDVLDLADNTVSTVKELYNEGQKELKPAMADLARTVDKLMPTADKYLPKAAAEALKKFADKNRPQEPARGASSYNDTAVAAMLAETFRYNAKADSRRDLQGNIKDELRSTINNQQHIENINQLDEIRRAVSQMSGYQRKVEYGYHRKSLELQARHYFVAVDSLQEARRHNSLTLQHLQGILQNTGLPDILKAKTTEKLKEQMKNKLVDHATNALFSTRDNFLTRMRDAVKAQTIGGLKATVDGFRSGLSGAEMASDVSATGADFGMDKFNMAGSMAGTFLADKARDLVAKRARNRIENDRTSKIMKGVRKFGNKLEYGVENAPQLLTDFSNRSTGAGEYASQALSGKVGDAIGEKWKRRISGVAGAVGDPLLDVARGTIRRANAMNNVVEQESASTLSLASEYTNKANKSITEVIPGLLARQLQELQIIRTGDANVDLMHYDFTKGGFTETKQLRKRIMGTLVSKDSKKGVTEEREKILAQVDPDGKLTAEQRKILTNRLMSDNLGNRAGYNAGKIKNYTSPFAFDSTEKEREHSQVFTDLFKELEKKDKANEGKHTVSFGTTFGRLGRSIGKGDEQIRELLKIYPRSVLEDMELFVRDADGQPTDQINMRRLQSLHADEEYHPSASPAPAGQRVQRIRQARGPVPQAPVAPAPAPAVEQQAAHQFDSGIVPAIQELQKTVSEGNNKPLIEEIKEVLMAIQARLDNGILTQAFPEGGIPPSAMPAGAGGGAAGRRGLLSRLNFRISDIAKGTWIGGKWAVGKAASIGNGLVGGGLNVAGRLIRGTAGLAKDAVLGAAGGAYRRARGFVDIYVGNEKKPRMYGRQLQEGNVYFNKDTDKPIRNIKDITGQVVSRIGGVEKVVLEADEIEDAWQREGAVKKTLKALGAVAKMGAKIGNGLVSTVLGGIPPVYRAGLWAAKKAWGLLDMAQDVFVKGQSEPALLARLMRAGAYYSATSGKQIVRPSMIDGPVLVGNGDDAETALSHDDLRKGLVDKNGKPLRTGLAKLLAMVGGMAMSGLKVAKKAGDMVWNAGKSVVSTGYNAGKAIIKTGINVAGFGLDRLRGKPWGDGGGGVAGVETVNWLKKIHDIIDARLPKPKAHAEDDSDGDGIRDGSYEDQVKKAKEAEAAKQAGAPNDPNQPSKPGVFGKMGAAAGSLWDRLRGKKKDADGNDVGGDGINVDVGGSGGKGGGAPKPKGPGFKETKGAWGKTKYLAKGAGRGIMKAGGWALKGGAALLGLEGLGLGGLAMGAGGALLSGAATAATAIGGVAAAAGTAIAGVISAPVLLAAAAVAAVGIAGYYGYKYLTKKKLTALTRVRYTQYGFTPADNDHVNAVFGLEDKLKPAIVMGKDGATLDQTKVDTEALLKDFDVDKSDPKALNKWLTWFGVRFKPVFLTHVTALNAVAPGKSIDQVDSLDGPLKLQYFNMTKYPNGPYNEFTSPFPDLKELPAGAGDVKAIIELVTPEIEKDAKTGNKAIEKTAIAAGAAVAAAGIGAAGADAVPKPMGMNQDLLNQVSKGNVDTSGLGAQGGKTSVAGSAAVLSALSANSLDAIDVVRLKTYGLVKMEADKVKALRNLETEIEKDLTFAKKVASWSGSLEQVLKTCGPAFGVDPTDDKRAGNWLTWFSARFLPTFLNYATVINAQTGKDKPSEGKALLKSNQLVDVATSIYTSSNRQAGGSNSAWTVTSSPWPDYELNTDVKSVDDNMRGLKESAKNAILAEPGGKGGNQPTAGKSAANSGADVAKVPETGNWFTRGISKIANVFKSDAPGVGGGAGTAGGVGAGGGGVGRTVDAPGKGTGGDIEGIPLPKGNGTWEAMKDTIIAASRMVGVDEKLMAVMAAIESSFDATAKAGTSSASGLYQFIDGTWKDMIKKYGGKYGIKPGTSRNEPRANALMGAEYIKENVAALTKVLKRPLTDTDIYFAHFLGSGGATKLLTANPDEIGAKILPGPAAANRSIFYDPNGQPLTVAQIYKLVQNRVMNKGKQFGISIAGGEAMVTSKTPNAPSSTAPTQGAAPGPDGGTAASGSKTAPVPTAIGAPTSAPTTSSGPSTAPPDASAGKASGPTATQTSITGPALNGIVPTKTANDDIAAQNRSQASSRQVDMGDTNQILTDTLQVHKDSFKLFERIAKAAEAMAASGTGPKTADSKTSAEAPPGAVPSQAARQATRTSSDLPRMPISVAKPSAVNWQQ